MKRITVFSKNANGEKSLFTAVEFRCRLDQEHALLFDLKKVDSVWQVFESDILTDAEFVLFDSYVQNLALSADTSPALALGKVTELINEKFNADFHFYLAGPNDEE